MNRPSFAMRGLGTSVALLIGIGLVLGPPAPRAVAGDPALILYQPDLSVPASFIGRSGVSTDGLGQLAPGGSLQAEVPAGSNVEFALLYAATVFGGNTTSLLFDGQTVALTPLPNVQNFFGTTRADVTGVVRNRVGTGGGVFNFVVGSDPTSPLLNGVALVVVYSNKNLPDRSISIFDGGLGFGPETTVLTFGRPFKKVPPAFQATLALGIQHGYQGGAGVVAGTHECGTDIGQYSIVDVNGQRLTSCAGNYDDGFGQDGALVTVGGAGDSTDLPADPLQTAGNGATPRVLDDELYDITSFVQDGDPALTLTTTNPSHDDSVFLAVLMVTGTATDTPPPLILPFNRGETWYVCQGYKQPRITHHGNLRFGLDLIPNRAGVGATGCTEQAPVGTDRQVRAPAGGNVAWRAASTGVMCINISARRSVMLGHMFFAGDAPSVSADDPVGTVAPPQSDKKQDYWNGGVSHIHIGVYDGSDCKGTPIPFDAAHGSTLGGYDLPDKGNEPNQYSDQRLTRS